MYVQRVLPISVFPLEMAIKYVLQRKDYSRQIKFTLQRLQLVTF